MRIRLSSVGFVAWAFSLMLLAGSAVGAVDKKPITHDVYDSWRSIQGTKISRDGVWLAYTLAPQDGDSEVVFRNLKTAQEFRHPRGKEPQITADRAFAVFTIAPPKADIDKAKKDKKKPEDQPKSGLGIIKLTSGEVFAVDRVKSFKLAEDASRFVAYLIEPEKKKAADKSAEEKKEEPATPEGEDKKKKEKKKDPGTELIIRDLNAGTQISVAEVTEYAWNKDGTWLAYAVSSKTPANDGAYAWRAADGTTNKLLTGLGNYKGLTFDEQGTQLAFVSDRDDYKADAPAFRLYYWQSSSESALELASGATSGFPAGCAVSENGRLEFSKDGERLFFGTAPSPKADPEGAPDPVKVDIWNWKDPELQPMQKARAEEEKKRNYQAVIHLKDRHFVQLATPEMPSVALIDNPARALGTSNVPYRQLVSWDTGYEDVYVVNLVDGSSQKILEKVEFPGMLSPGGGYALYFDKGERDWYSYRIADGKRFNLTDKLKTSFQDETWDTPGTPRPYGIAGWTPEDRSVLIYDRYDIWELQPDASNARMVTSGLGRSKNLVFRYQRLDPEEKTIPADKPLLLSVTDDQTKATGYYRVILSKPGDASRVVMQDKLFGSLIKAKNAETLVFTLQRFEEFPNLWTSDGNFSGMAKISDANPQQSEYIWGRSELIDYRNADGKMLRAVLIKPENFDPSKKYPLMVYIYEELTNGLHRYVAPSPGTSINIARYVSNGYVILEPDINYDTGYPGQSAMKCVIPAVEKVVDMGFIDPGRIGIQGHSWGGYQITYMITQTDIFRAVEAGASVSNMISAYGGIRWGTGMSRAFQYERTQSRIGAPPWERPLQFIENSPIFWVEKVSTPYLTIANDEDDAVPWYQGIEFFSAMRRLGKEAYMFNFNGEKHGLRERENQKYWTVHMTEFFDHYLKDAPRPEWMDKGVPYLERGKRDMTPFYPKKSTETAPPPKELKPALDSITAAGMLKHVQVLASDEFEGRGPGTKGEELTIGYLQDQCKKLGLKPGNPDGSYIQKVPLMGFVASPEASFTSGAQKVDLKFPTDYVAVSRRYNPETKVDNSDIVFVGYGVVAPEYKWDDFKDYDVRGKTVVMLVNDPPVPDSKDPSKLDDLVFKGRAMTYYGRWTYKFEIASQKGSAAVLLVHETGPAGYPWEVVVGSWGRENFDIRAPGGNAGRVAVESWISSDTARKLFSMAGKDFDELKKSAASRDFRPVPLNARANLRVRNTLRRIQSNNVIAKLEGSDPALKNEYVIYTAHWDHLGKDEKLQGDKIFNGARDNATGIAALLELARAFTQLEKLPKRTVLFLAVTAEEKGLLGAKYYAENPLYPLARTLADINMDGMNQWGRTKDIVVVGLGNSTLDDILKEEASKTGRYLKPDPEPEKGFFYRSDHFEFAKLGVPALDPGSGMEFIGKPPEFGAKKSEEYTASVYHKVTDEIKPDWDLSGAAEDTQLFFSVGYRVAQEARMPEWKPGTEFKARRDTALKTGKP